MMKCHSQVLGVLACLFAAMLPALPARADVAPVASGDEQALLQLQQRLLQPALLRADFVQEKQVQGFRNPLRAQGHFVLARDKGVIWSVLKPFPSQVVLTRERILSRQGDGALQVQADGRQQPALRAVNGMLFALMSGDIRQLQSGFRLSAEVDAGQGWSLMLEPRNPMLARAFVRIRMSGDRYVRQVDIEEANHDATHLRFSGFSQSPALAADEERSLADR